MYRILAVARGRGAARQVGGAPLGGSGAGGQERARVDADAENRKQKRSTQVGARAPVSRVNPRADAHIGLTRR